MMNRSFMAALLVGIGGLRAGSPGAQTWTDITSALTNTLTIANPGNCGAVNVDRTTGDIIVGVCTHGLWKSTNQGKTWACLDSTDFGASRFEFSWGLDMDPNNARRMAGFSIYGGSAVTLDGVHWTAMSKSHFDFGQVDWSSASPRVLMATGHESNGQVWLSTDGSATWKQLAITVDATGGGATEIAMLGVIDSTTLIYSNGNGIFRSTDVGANWSKVSDVNPQTRTPTLFKGVCYLGTATGLLVSADKGATWQARGATTNIWRGPYFGADENTMVVQGNLAIYESTDRGDTWIKISGLPPNANWPFTIDHFGGIAWDPINNLLYGNPCFSPVVMQKLAVTSVAVHEPTAPAARVHAATGTIRSAVPFDRVELFSLSGARRYDSRRSPLPVAQTPNALAGNWLPAIVRVSAGGREIFRGTVLPNESR
jgi:hypothetical protein